MMNEPTNINIWTLLPVGVVILMSMASSLPIEKIIEVYAYVMGTAFHRFIHGKQWHMDFHIEEGCMLYYQLNVVYPTMQCGSTHEGIPCP